MHELTVKIDGQEFKAREGQTILEVARENGIFIPSLCYHRKTTNIGACRVCVVEVEGARSLVASCCNPVTQGMIVRTNTPKVLEAQRMVVELLWASGDHNCLTCDQNGCCELQDLIYRLKIEKPRFEIQPRGYTTDKSGVMISRDPNKCILCGRCIEACNNVVVNEVLSFANRGSYVQVACDYNLPMGSSKCVQCGECVQICPVGAITDKKAHGGGRPWELEKYNTTCPYCGVGCQVTVHVNRAENRIVKVTGREVPPNDGMLCVKGRYGYEFPSSPNRLTQPMIKKNGKHVPVSWDEALDYTADRIRAIIDRDGPDVFSAFGSGRVPNETNYAIMKFTRAVVKTNNVDHCART